jgi:hypothetical protein
MIAGAVSGLLTGASFAQERRPMVFTQSVPGPMGVIGGVIGPAGPDNVMYTSAGMAGGATVQFMSAEMSFEGAQVKGAPYSAEAVTETTQVLSDGNRISRKTTASLHRDGEGRTRREQSLPAIGPWATSGTPPINVFINDPVSGVNYILESNSKTARKVTAGKFTAAMPAKFAGNPKSAMARLEMRAPDMKAPDIKEEQLPSRLMEGVQAEGTRSTITIPAGEVGNERPIDIVSERWYSPELKTVLMTKHSDPRMGETVYKLTGLQRSEPPHSLFEVPADYTIADDSDVDALKRHKLMMEKMTLDHKE